MFDPIFTKFLLGIVEKMIFYVVEANKQDHQISSKTQLNS